MWTYASREGVCHGPRSMIWSVNRVVIPRSFGSPKILVIHGIGIGLYYSSNRWGQPIYILGFLEGVTPIPTMHWRWYNKRNGMYCLWCVGQRMEHPHFNMYVCLPFFFILFFSFLKRQKKNESVRMARTGCSSGWNRSHVPVHAAGLAC